MISHFITTFLILTLAIFFGLKPERIFRQISVFLGVFFLLSLSLHIQTDGIVMSLMASITLFVLMVFAGYSALHYRSKPAPNDTITDKSNRRFQHDPYRAYYANRNAINDVLLVPALSTQIQSLTYCIVCRAIFPWPHYIDSVIGRCALGSIFRGWSAPFGILLIVMGLRLDY